MAAISTRSRKPLWAGTRGILSHPARAKGKSDSQKVDAVAPRIRPCALGGKKQVDGCSSRSDVDETQHVTEKHRQDRRQRGQSTPCGTFISSTMIVMMRPLRRR